MCGEELLNNVNNQPKVKTKPEGIFPGSGRGLMNGENVGL